jgi:hypothetical protein
MKISRCVVGAFLVFIGYGLMWGVFWWFGHLADPGWIAAGQIATIFILCFGYFALWVWILEMWHMEDVRK